MSSVNSPDQLVTALRQRLPEAAIITAEGQIDEAIRSSSPLSPGRRPMCIAQPTGRDELQSLVTLANELDLNLAVTSSTGLHRNGGSASSEENLLVDLSTWRKIDLVDRRNRVCRIEPGVTYGQLTAELAEHGLTLPVPLAPRDGKSALASIMDREPTTWPNKQWDASDPAGSTEFIFGNGQLFRTGAAGGPGTIEQQRRAGGAQKFSSGPSQTDFHRIVQGAQGTMGIVTWITVRCELKPTIQRAFLAGSEELEDLLPFVYGVQRGLLGEQGLALDRTAAAMLFANGSQDEFERIRRALPKYLYLQNIAGFERLPRERLDYHLAEIQALARQAGIALAEQVGPLTGAELLKRATQPCGPQDWRDCLHGGSISIFFLTTLDRAPAFRQLFETVVADHGLTDMDFGTYIQPVVQNHACHVEFILPFDPGSDGQIRRLKDLEEHVVQELMRAGAFFSRPYGSAARMVWAQNSANYQLVRTVKGIFDPNRILQRGKWGF
jgi:FAD/FMN-containing dehydrogenase